MMPTALPARPPLHGSSSLLGTGLEKTGIVPRVFPLESENEEPQQSCCSFNAGDMGANKDELKGQVPRWQGN